MTFADELNDMIYSWPPIKRTYNEIAEEHLERFKINLFIATFASKEDIKEAKSKAREEYGAKS